MKPRVLMIAYACNPQGSGEHWLGWGWAEQAAQSFSVELITTPNAAKEVAAGSNQCGIISHFVEIPNWFRKFTELTGTSWLRKLLWQRRAYQLAKKLHAAQPFDIVHQTTFHTFRIPFLASGLDIPSVWGPIAGGERAPPGFQSYLRGARFAEAGRTIVNRLSLQFPSITRSLRQTSVLFVSNQTTLNFLPREVHGKAQIVPPNALRPQDEACLPPPPKAEGETKLRLLYVGNCVATRSMPMVFDALRVLGLTDYELKIAGDGPALDGWRAQVQRLGLETQVKFMGKVPYSQLSDLYSAADALVFPALRDSGGSALLEAMARYLPVICLDWAGPGEMVDGSSGIKIPVSDPAQTVKAFADAFVRLKAEPEWRSALGAAARKRAKEKFGWEAKRELLERTYRKLIGRGGHK